MSLDTPVGEDGETSLGTLIPLDADGPEEEAQNNELRRVIATALHTLPDRERQVIALRYGANDEPPRSLTETGKQLGVSPKVVEQLEQRGLEALSRRPELAALREAAYTPPWSSASPPGSSESGGGRFVARAAGAGKRRFLTLRLLGGLGAAQRPRRWAVDALVPVVPANAIARRRLAHDLLDDAGPRRSLRRLRLDLDVFADRESHAYLRFVSYGVYHHPDALDPRVV